MNPKIAKINEEIDKLRSKILTYQSRLRELERQKTEIENADIIALVRGIDVPPNEFSAFVRLFKERQNCAVPDLLGTTHHPKTETEEDSTIEN